MADGARSPANLKKADTIYDRRAFRIPKSAFLTADSRFVIGMEFTPAYKLSENFAIQRQANQ